jgi:transcriptional regulator with XRE-family HTH domain
VSISAGRLALGDRLRQYRMTAGLSGSELARRLGWQNSKVSRIELARQGVTDADITAWCGPCQISDDEAAALHDELRAIRMEEARLSGALRAGHAAVQHEVEDREAHATRIRVFDHAVVPGLAQTPEYARQLFIRLAELRDTPRDADAAVAVRMRRQQVLYDPNRQVEMLVTEAALRYPPCTKEAMAGQIDRLLGLASLSTVWFGIIPLDTPLTVLPLHGFWIFDDSLATVEILNTEMATTDPEDVALYQKVFDELKAASVTQERARQVLLRLAAR